jgi:hypothetical protein
MRWWTYCAGASSMKVSSDYRDLLSALSAKKARVLVVGAYAVMHHTTPRYTKDLDLWVEPTRANAQRVLRALATFGAPLARVTVADLSQPGLVYQLGVEPVRVDILTSVPGLTFRAAFRRAVSLRYADVEVKVLCLEDTLTAKRAAGRAQDLLDLKRLEQAQATTLRGKTRATPARKRARLRSRIGRASRREG